MSSTAPEGGWDLRIGAFERHFCGWLIESPDGVHYTAQRKTSGRASGPKLKARTLDELAALIDAAPGRPSAATAGTLS